MAFRDDLEAAQARGAALEQRVAELEAANRELRGEVAEPGVEAPPLALGRTRVWPAYAGVALLAAGAGAAAALGQLAVAAVIAVAAVSLLVLALILASALHLIPAGGIAVIAGRRRVGPGGREVGYRLARHGRVIAVPLIETIELLDTRPRTVEARVAGAYTRGNVAVAASVRAVIKVASTEPVIDNAVERFLGRQTSEIDRCARETLEGHVRGVFARLTLDEIRADAIKLAHELIAESESDLRRLGLEIDRLEVVSVERSG